MKKPFLLLLVICFSTLSFSQSRPDLNPKKLKLTRVDFSFGIDNDHFSSMNHSNIISLAQNQDEMTRNLNGLDEEASGFTAGGAFYINAAFAPLNKFNGAYKLNQELRVGIGFHSQKEAMVSFKNEDLDTAIVFCNLHRERSVNVAYVFNKSLCSKWNVYAGVQGQIGWTKGNEMMIIAGKYFGPDEHPSMQDNKPENIQQYDAKSMVYNRITIPFGISHTCNEKWTYGLDFRRGLGFQKVIGGPTNYIKRSGGFMISFKRNL